MSSAVAIIEQARSAGIVLWYDASGDIYTWARKGSNRTRRRRLTRLIQTQFNEIQTLLKLAVLETA